MRHVSTNWDKDTDVLNYDTYIELEFSAKGTECVGAANEVLVMVFFVQDSNVILT